MGLGSLALAPLELAGSAPLEPGGSAPLEMAARLGQLGTVRSESVARVVGYSTFVGHQQGGPNVGQRWYLWTSLSHDRTALLMLNKCGLTDYSRHQL